MYTLPYDSKYGVDKIPKQTRARPISSKNMGNEHWMQETKIIKWHQMTFFFMLNGAEILVYT